MSQVIVNRPYEMPVKTMTIVPAADLTAHRYKFVALNSTGKAVLATAAKNAVGIVQQPGEIDTVLPAMFAGISFCYFDGAVAAGDDIEVGTDGKAKKASTGVVVGVCIAGGASGELGCCLLK